MRRLAMFLPCALGCVWPLSASTDQASSSALIQYLRKGGLDLRPGTYFVHNITAPGKRPVLLLVYLEGRDWCGSSGCELSVVNTSGPQFRTIVEMNAWTPITSDGWSNSGYEIIGAWHHGGGGMKPRCEELRFKADGSEYIHETKREPLLEQKRCASSKNVLLKKDWH